MCTGIKSVLQRQVKYGIYMTLYKKVASDSLSNF